MNRVVRGVLVPLSVVAVLAGCAMDPTSPASTTSRTASTTAKLRPVTIPYRDGLVYTFEETSAQALCHALSPQAYLHVTVATEPGDNDQRDLLRRLVTTLLTRLAHDGPVTPVDNADGALAFAPTQPVPGVRLSDLPRPVQALVLCTAMTRTGAPNVTYVNMAGECAADDSDRRASVTVEDNDGGPARFTIGGRPARFTNRGAIVITLAELPWDEPEHLYVRLTVEWLFADQATAKAWADQFVTQLGEL